MIRDLFERLVDAAFDKAYDWACGAYKVNWFMILYFGVCVPAMILITIDLVKGCNSGY